MSNNDIKLCIAHSEWNKVLELIKADPSLTKKRYAIVLRAFSNEWRDASDLNPLHHLCSIPDVPIPILDTVLLSYPEALCKTESTLHRSCLHIAILKDLRDEIIIYLIEQFPLACQMQDKYGRVPLHYACSMMRNFEIIKKLIRAFPSCICATDWKLWTPLHAAVSVPIDPAVIDFMVSIRPEAICMKTVEESDTLQLSMKSDNETEVKEMHMEIIVKKDEELTKLPVFQNYLEATGRDEDPTLHLRKSCLV